MHAAKPEKIQVIFPRRAPSIVMEERRPVFTTPDKTTCAECTCFPKDSPYRKPPILRPCQWTPLTLYELAAKVVNRLQLPIALEWTVKEVVYWLDVIVGLPQYQDCFIDNHINGRRLLLLEDGSRMTLLNIHIHEHIKRIGSEIHKLFSTEFIKFTRSIGLPPRKPLTHCTLFKSRTGPSWGIRQNWTRCDILRWMKILDPEPVHLDHWDLVWYEEPDFPKTMFARIPSVKTDKIPIYKPPVDICNEYKAPRKFTLEKEVSNQFIWMEHRTCSMTKTDLLSSIQQMHKTIKPKPSPTRLFPQKICLEGLKGKDLILARRLRPNEKFVKTNKSFVDKKKNK